MRCRTIPWPCVARTPRLFGEQEPGQTREVHFDLVGYSAEAGFEFVYLYVAGGKPGPAKIQRSKALALVESDRRFRWLIVEISQQLELDDCRARLSSSDPTPDLPVLGHKLCVAERLLQSRGVHGPARNLKVYGSPPANARRPPLLARRRCASRRTREAT